MKYILALVLLTSPFFLQAQNETLKLPWSSLGDWHMDWEAAEDHKTTWQLTLNQKDTLYYTAFNKTFDLSVEQVAQRMVKNIQANYYKARYVVLSKDISKDTEMEYVLFSIESKEYIPTASPLTSIYMIVLGKDKTFILSTDLQTHKLKGSDKKKWVSFFKSAKLGTGHTGLILSSI